MTDQIPDPWQYLAEFIEGNALRPPGGQQTGGPRFPLVPSVAKELRGIVEAGRQALAAERAQHQQALIDQRAIGHGEGQGHTIDDVNAGRIDPLIAPRLDTLRAERDAAQQQVATLTQELSVSRANHIDANQRNMQSVRELEAAEARCATLQGAVAADEERLRQAAARAGVLFVGCDTADALADRCATLTAALEPFAAAWPSMRDAGATTALLRDYEAAHRAISGVPTP